ncbi:hypothetical protein KC345_g274 [Hortaea werneckii]|nr:hypothetical protein KC345_g274 [Hortaea werneckii]
MDVPLTALSSNQRVRQRHARLDADAASRLKRLDRDNRPVSFASSLLASSWNDSCPYDMRLYATMAAPRDLLPQTLSEKNRCAAHASRSQQGISSVSAAPPPQTLLGSTKVG